MQDWLVLNRFNRVYLDRLLADLPEELWDVQPQPGLHSVRWILAHLAICVDFGMKQLNLPGMCPADWLAAYGPRSSPGTAEQIRPSRQQLLDVIERGYELLISEASRADPSILELPQQLSLLPGNPLRTRRDLLGHLLVTHFAVHLGQLSSLRRLLGKPPLF